MASVHMASRLERPLARPRDGLAGKTLETGD
jgi:hypothetical protein